ncbi:MAG: hypothetical protein AAFY60_08135, partial [Myxococcota bacterium]
GQPPPIPILFAPNDGSTVRSAGPTLEVVTVADLDGDETRYDFQVFTDAALTALYTQVSDVPESPGRTEWEVAPPLQDQTTYFWRARASDSTGLVSDWSEAFSFQVDLTNAPPAEPVILVPAVDGEVFDVNPPTVVFSGVRADQDGEDVTYQVLLDADPAFQSGLLQRVDGVVVDATGEGRFTPSGLLTPNLTYYVRIAGDDGLGLGEAAERSFTVSASAGSAVPTLLSPKSLEGVSTLTPELVASRLANDELDYEFAVYSDLELSNAVTLSPNISGDGDEVRWTVDTELSGGEVYYWRVRSVDTAGNPGGWSEVGSFFVDVDAPDGGCACNNGATPGLWSLLMVFGGFRLLWRRRKEERC